MILIRRNANHAWEAQLDCGMSSPDNPDELTQPGRFTITVKPSGTIVIHGPANIVDPEGNPLTIPIFKQPGVIKLCGCGKSANRPFCDGSHKTAVSSEK
jgi:hypothetical protein